MRDNAAAEFGVAGRQQEQKAVKSTQETLQEIVRSYCVLQRALQDAGPPALDAATGRWPSDEAVEKLREALSLAPPRAWSTARPPSSI